jgi:hypothetical protein
MKHCLYAAGGEITSQIPCLQKTHCSAVIQFFQCDISIHTSALVNVLWYWIGGAEGSEDSCCGVSESIIVRWIFRKWDVGAWTG